MFDIKICHEGMYDNCSLKCFVSLKLYYIFIIMSNWTKLLLFGKIILFLKIRKNIGLIAGN